MNFGAAGVASLLIGVAVSPPMTRFSSPASSIGTLGAFRAAADRLGATELAHPWSGRPSSALGDVGASAAPTVESALSYQWLIEAIRRTRPLLRGLRRPAIAAQGRTDDHPVGHFTDLFGLVGSRDPHPDAHGQIAIAPDALDDRLRVGPEVALLPGHPHTGHGIDKTPRPRTDRFDPVLGARGRYQHDGIDPGPVGLDGPRGDLFEGQVRNDRTAHPDVGHRARHAPVPGAKHEVVIGHHGEGHAHLSAGQVVEDPRRDRPATKRGQRCLLDNRSVHHRIRKRDPDLDGVGPGPHHGRK